jgi:hypothetical protein
MIPLSFIERKRNGSAMDPADKLGCVKKWSGFSPSFARRGEGEVLAVAVKNTFTQTPP